VGKLAPEASEMRTENGNETYVKGVGEALLLVRRQRHGPGHRDCEQQGQRHQGQAHRLHLQQQTHAKLIFSHARKNLLVFKKRPNG